MKTGEPFHLKLFTYMATHPHITHNLKHTHIHTQLHTHQCQRIDDQTDTVIIQGA